ncbi:MAG: MFS transporter [Candidatus Limnocylindrales bacterium]
MSRDDRLVLLGVLCLASGFVGIELMAVSVALPSLVEDLADWTQLRRASWVVNGYLLAYIAVMPLAGRAADRFGLPRLLVIALGLFGLGSLLSGAAGSLDTLVAARVVQGLGGGAILPLATAGASQLFEGHARARALGAVSASNFLGMALGPFIGATVLEHFDLGPALVGAGLGGRLAFDLLVPAWRWIFYLGAPAALVAIAWTWAAASGWQRPSRPGSLDVTGAVLVTTALTSGLVWLTTLGEQSGGLPVGLVALVACVAATLAAVRHMRRTAEPFLDPIVFRDRVTRAAVLVSLLTGYALATAIIAAAVWVDRVRYGGPSEQRLLLGALALAMAIGAIGSGYLLRRVSIVALGLVGLGFAIGGILLLGSASADTARGVLLVGLAAFGLGFGLTVTPRSTAAVESLGPRLYGMASAAVTVARMAGMAVGLSVLTAFGTGRIETLSVVVTDQAARDAVLPPELRGRPLADPLVVDVLETWASAQAASILAGLFLVAALVLMAAIVPTLMLRLPTTAGGRATMPGHEQP